MKNGIYISTDSSKVSMPTPSSIRMSTQSGGDAFAFDLTEIKKLNDLTMHSGN